MKNTMHHWPENLTEVESIFSELQSTTENEFMVIGEKLGEISNFTDAIFQQIQNINETLTSEENLETSNNIVDKLEGIKNYINFNLEKTVEETAELNLQKRVFCNIDAPLKLLSKMVFRLNTLGFSIKVETTRISQQDNEFDYLGKEVRKLATDTKENLLQIQTSREAIIQLISKGTEDMLQLKEKEFVPLQTQLDQLLTQMLSYQQIISDVKHNAEEVAQQFLEINNNIGEIIFELQFHDIVRQQIEHVGETIANLKKDIAQHQNSSKSGDKNLYTTIYATNLLSVELTDNARQTVMKALTSILDKFEIIQNKTSRVGDHLAAFVHESLQSVEKITTQASAEKQNIETTLLDAVKVHRNRINTVRSIYKTADSIKSQVNEISSIGEDTSLISLNGLIQAHHLQKDGAVMGVVIGEIRNLVESTHENIEALEDHLRELDSFIDDSGSKSEGEPGENETHSIIEKTLETLGFFFTSLNKKAILAQQLGQTVQQQSKVFSEELTTTLQKITVGEKFDNFLGSSIVILKDLIEKMEVDEDEIDQVKVQEMLEEYRGNYTMASERIVHDRVAGQDTSEAHIEDDCDDNIELF